MSLQVEPLPVLSDAVVPPRICGTADLAHLSYSGNDFDRLAARVAGFHDAAAHGSDHPARIYDMSVAYQLGFRRAEALDLQDAALDRSRLYRVGAGADTSRPLRLLALCAPGDLMINAPLDFLTNALDVRLDLLFLLPDHPLPAVIPDHDVAFFAVSEADDALLARLCSLFARWPRPVLNDPRFLPTLRRDALARVLAGAPGICSPTAVAATRAALEAHVKSGAAIPGFPGASGPYPCLIRPEGSHAGASLARLTSPEKLAEYLLFSWQERFFLTAFEDYSGPDGLYRKSRVAFIDRRPFLCHMAVSRNWKVHYLNAGMRESAEKRAEEARAMAEFDRGFARRHSSAFASLHKRLRFDYYSVDCAETRDGRLLVFEADTAAIVHLMDPEDLFPYKPPQMRKVFDAFGDMLRRHAAMETVSG